VEDTLQVVFEVLVCEATVESFVLDVAEERDVSTQGGEGDEREDMAVNDDCKVEIRECGRLRSGGWWFVSHVKDQDGSLSL
jgi:hypothetical protein